MPGLLTRHEVKMDGYNWAIYYYYYYFYAYGLRESQGPQTHKND